MYNVIAEPIELLRNLGICDKFSFVIKNCYVQRTYPGTR